MYRRSKKDAAEPVRSAVAVPAKVAVDFISAMMMKRNHEKLDRVNDAHKTAVQELLDAIYALKVELIWLIALLWNISEHEPTAETWTSLTSSNLHKVWQYVSDGRLI